MTIKCRLCGVAFGPLDPDDVSKLAQVMAEHLKPHRWELLKFIAGQEGDGSVERMVHSLAFEASGPEQEHDAMQSAWHARQKYLLFLATQSTAITGKNTK